MLHTFVFWAENETDPIYFTSCLKEFYKDMLGSGLDEINDVTLEELLKAMEVYVDVDDKRAILIYESNVLE
jgi:hypothetical protein